MPHYLYVDVGKRQVVALVVVSGQQDRAHDENVAVPKNARRQLFEPAVVVVVCDEIIIADEHADSVHSIRIAETYGLFESLQRVLDVDGSGAFDGIHAESLHDFAPCFSFLAALTMVLPKASAIFRSIGMQSS